MFTIDDLDALCRVDTRVKPLDLVLHDAGLYWPDEEREVPAYRKVLIDMCREQRELIEPYWTSECDEVVREAVARCGVNARRVLCDLLRKTWGEAKFAALKENVNTTISGLHLIVGGYGMARAERLSFPFQHHIRRCLYCGEQFSDSDPGLSGPIDAYSDLCVNCHHLAFQMLLSYSPDGPRKEGFPTDRQYLSDTLRTLCQVFEQVLTSEYVRHAIKALQARHPKKNAILAALVPMQPAGVYTRVFGSWLAALKDSGLIDPEAQRGTFGVVCVAEDGHSCESLAERNVDDWLWRRGIPHTRAPSYPRTSAASSNLKADWAVGGALVEYWGRKGSEGYDTAIKTKRAIAKSANITLVEITPEDLANPDSALTRKFADFL